MRIGAVLLASGLLASAVPSQRRDASTIISEGKNDEGEDHDPLDVPTSARIKSIPVGSDGEEVALYWNQPRTDQSPEARSAYIMIHGRLRDGNNYWEMMNDALKSAVEDEYPGIDDLAFVIAPQFFSTIYNEGQYEDQQLAWGDVNGWQAGDPATHPKETIVTSIDALDAIVGTLAHKDDYPNISNITLVGHGGGGQLITRYAAVGTIPSGVHVRFIVGDASTHPYFTEHRPVTYDVDGKGCKYWNTWRYGFDNFTGTAVIREPRSPQEYFSQYINRDVVILVGKDDTASNGDQYCPARMQGGDARRDRNLAWWAYINTLARRSEPVELFEVANFTDLPDWGLGSDGKFGPRLVVIEDADHDAGEVFGSEEGRAALFSGGDVLQGWRPKGYDDQRTDCRYCADDNNRK